MNRNLVSGLAIGVFVGFLAGYFVGASHDNDAAPAVPPAPQAAAPSRPNPMDLMNHIITLRQTVADDPKNVKAWIALGNDYFDTQQAQNAVDAYAKALALAPGDPNVLTDQGVMYRQLKNFPKAVADFTQAHQLDPRHQQSLFNLGVVYASDLQQPQAALKAWNQVLAIDPTSQQAEQARAAIAQLQQAKP